jgi:hypothetical protein
LHKAGGRENPASAARTREAPGERFLVLFLKKNRFAWVFKKEPLSSLALAADPVSNRW